MKPRTTRWQRAWNIWLVLPEVVRMALLLIAFVIVAWFSGDVHAQDIVLPVPAEPICKDDRLVGITIEIPIPGRVTFSFPPGLCAPAKPPPKPPAKST